MEARCVCGGLKAESAAEPIAVVACHCLDCQRRTGSPFGVTVYYPRDQVTVSGERSEYIRPTMTGGQFTSWFCPTCGSSVAWVAGRHPEMLGVALGAMADPGFRGPYGSIYEQTRHDWVDIATADEHLQRGRFNS